MRVNCETKLRRWQGLAEGRSTERPSVYLGACTEREYEEAAGHLRALQTAKRFGRTPVVATLSWLQGLDDVLHERVARAGLCESRQVVRARNVSVSEHVAAYQLAAI